MAAKKPNRAAKIITKTAVKKAAAKVVKRVKESIEQPAERRAPDQDAALETAFESGALPEVDRREEAPKAPKAKKAKAPKGYEWIARGDGVKQLYKDGQRCDHIPEEDRDHVYSLLEE
jgi:hypothetical protein